MSGPPVHYDCDVCDCSPCVCDRTSADPWTLDEGWVEETPTVTLDQFLLEEVERIERFRAWYLAEAAKPENTTPEGEPMFPLEMAPGEWDQQMLAFSDEEG